MINWRLSGVALALSTSLLVGCNHTQTKLVTLQEVSPQVMQHSGVNQVLNTPLEQLWSVSFDHHQSDLLAYVADAITRLAAQPSLNDQQYQQLDRLTYYLRIYSSFGPDKDWSEQTAAKLHRALMVLQSMPGFETVTTKMARLHENYAVALYRLYNLEPMQGYTAEHVKPLSQLIELYANQTLDNNKAIDHGLWEVLRAGALLPYEARRKNTPEYIEAVQGQGELQQALLNFVTAKNAVKAGRDWPRQHALWALAQWYNLHQKIYLNEYYQLSKAEQKALDDKETRLAVEQQMSALDEQIWTALASLSQEQRKQAYSVPYLVNSFRDKSACAQTPLKGRCIEPSIEQALPQRKDCSESLFILAQSMTEQQLEQSCKRLVTQTSHFHQTLDTKEQPVANDFNDKLRVVVFDDQAQYNIYGQLIFDIATDNGGMYIEGTPQDPDNQATFFAYEQFWSKSGFKVWNLNHEYVHYLDGRYVKYDTFGHFPSHLVWWSEGLAEYISKGDDNQQAVKILHDIEKDQWLSLKQVFDTEYKDGGDQVYRWGYMAVRFLAETQPQTYRKMAHYLTTDFFDGYKNLLDTTAESQQQAFATWLEQYYRNNQAKEAAKDPRKPREFYRYSYRRYLQPEHLSEELRHMHWQYDTVINSQLTANN